MYLNLVKIILVSTLLSLTLLNYSLTHTLNECQNVNFNYIINVYSPYIQNTLTCIFNYLSTIKGV